VIARRLGALERVACLLADWRHTKLRLADTETRITGVLDQLELTELVISISGLSSVGAAAILAETGDGSHIVQARDQAAASPRMPQERTRVTRPMSSFGLLFKPIDQSGRRSRRDGHDHWVSGGNVEDLLTQTMKAAVHIYSSMAPPIRRRCRRKE
jgi:hypothetical protein